MSSSEDWMEQAPCRLLTREQKNNYLFRESPHTRHTREFVSKLCGPCPVRQQCLDFAVSNRIGTGCPAHIYGGLDQSGRMKYVRNEILPPLVMEARGRR
jgi:Transcription factor WhiB